MPTEAERWLGTQGRLSVLILYSGCNIGVWPPPLPAPGLRVLQGLMTGLPPPSPSWTPHALPRSLLRICLLNSIQQRHTGRLTAPVKVLNG